MRRRVVVHPVADGFEIELVGDLAQMVAVAQAKDGNKAASVGEASRSVKLVAGAGFGFCDLRGDITHDTR